jgi:dTDP-4-dehydrorhamnose reductase
MVVVGLIGATGFVGKEISRALLRHNYIETVNITKQNFGIKHIRETIFDVLIHSANPARRFHANSNPSLDYLDTVEKTSQILKDFNFKKIILISSFSCRTQSTSPYGFNRLKCEELVSEHQGAILRLGPMYGGDRHQDTLHDIVAGRDVFYSKETKYSYCDVTWTANYIASNLNHFSGLIEIGASNYITLSEIAQYVSSNSFFGTELDDQITENFALGPDAKGVLEFADEITAHR